MGAAGCRRRYSKERDQLFPGLFQTFCDKARPEIIIYGPAEDSEHIGRLAGIDRRAAAKRYDRVRLRPENIRADPLHVLAGSIGPRAGNDVDHLFIDLLQAFADRDRRRQISLTRYDQELFSVFAEIQASLVYNAPAEKIRIPFIFPEQAVGLIFQHFKRAVPRVVDLHIVEQYTIVHIIASSLLCRIIFQFI